MKFRCLCLALLVVSCESRSKFSVKPKVEGETGSGVTIPQNWFQLEYGLSEYLEMQPGRPIIVTFGADWTMSSQHNWRILFTSNLSKELEKAEFLCLYSDSSTNSNLAEREMLKLNRYALPVTAVFNPKDSQWIVLPTVFAKEDILALIQQLQTQKAEQYVPPKSDRAGG